MKKAETKNSLKSLKFKNRKLVLSFMRASGAVSVNEISHATSLSKMTVHKIIDHYLAEGVISHSGKGVSTEEGGKKPNLFSFNAYSRFIYAIRLGGNYLSTSIVNLKGEMVVGKKSYILDNVSLDDLLHLIGKAFREQSAEKDLPVENCLAAVVGANGAIDIDNGILLASYCNPDWGHNIPLRDRIGTELPGNIPVHMDSWWRHLAHGEMHYAKNGSRDRFFLIGNSGNYISGGLVHHRQVCQGATGIAGEIGHLIVAPTSGVRCVCGGIGCLEALVSPSRIMRLAEERRPMFPDSDIFTPETGTVGFREIGEIADQGDNLARLLLDEVAGHFAVAINNIVQICDPGRIVLFGDYSRMGKYFLDTLHQRIAAQSMHGVDKRTTAEYSTLSDDHSVVGAATHMTDRLFASGS